MITEGTDTSEAIPRRSIETGDKIPNAAVFLKRTAIEFLQILFNTREAGSFHYDQDDTKSEILIADIHAVDLKTVGARPAIIAVRGPLSWQGIGLGHNALETRDMRTGSYTFNDLLIGSLALSCISREGIEAEDIGHIVFNSFTFFKPILRKYGFFSIKSLNIGAESLIESEGADDKTSIVSIYITAQIQDRWTLHETYARKLEKIIIESVFDTPK